MDRPAETEKMIDKLFAGKNVRQKEIDLIRLYAEDGQDEARWKAFFETVDFDNEPYTFCYMLSRLGAKFDWKLIPGELIPRLKGIRKKISVRNIKKLYHVTNLMRLIQSENIPMCIIKGGALRLVLLPDCPRPMSDVDIVVPEEMYSRAVEITVENGYSVSKAIHSTDILIDDEQILDIHPRSYKSNLQGNDPDSLFDDPSLLHHKGDIDFYIKSVEDVFLQLMVTAFDDYRCGSGKGLIVWVADLIDLADKYDVSYDTVCKRAEQCNVVSHFTVAASMLRRFVPGRFKDLYEKAGIDKGISKRTIRRTNAFLDVKYEPEGMSPFVRFFSVIKYYHVINVNIYHLEDSSWKILKEYPAFIRKILKVNSLSGVPKAVSVKMRSWH